jgi:ubiquinone biosynthesis protein
VAYRHLKRLRQIAQVLAKHGFGEFLDQLRVWEYTNIKRRLLRRKEREPSHLTAPQRLRLALEELGPTFVKLGQVLSTRPDLMPQNFVAELEKLQNQVSPVPFLEIKQIVEDELCHPLTEVFTSFEEEPVAAASLSQVHMATLKTNNSVAVKVQRPDIEELIEADLEILYTLVTLTQRHLQRFGIANPVGLVNEFSHNIRRELDFRLEANNMRRYEDDFQSEDYIHVPRVYTEFCTERLLVMEFISGISVSETEALEREGYDLSLVAQRCADIWLKSTLEHGFFHADPHPGNVFVLPGNSICLLDYGMMGTVSISQREKLSWLMYYISRSDEKRAARSLLDLAEPSDGMSIKPLEMKAGNLIAEYSNLPVNELHLGILISRLWQLLKENSLSFDNHLIWLLKTVATGEDIARRLRADFNMVEYARPYVARVIRCSLNPLRQISELQLTTLDLMGLLRDLPYEARRLMAQLTGGKLKIEFEHVGLEPIRKTLNQITNRLVMALILASLIVGSSLIVLSGLPPLIANIPIIGLAGYVVSGIFALWLVISILRSSAK